NRRPRSRRTASSTAQLHGQRHDRRAAGEGIVARGRPEASAMTLDDTARERKREAEAASSVVERPRRAFVCLLYARIFCDDDDGGFVSAARVDATLHDDGRRTRL